MYTAHLLCFIFNGLFIESNSRLPVPLFYGSHAVQYTTVQSEDNSFIFTLYLVLTLNNLLCPISKNFPRTKFIIYQNMNNKAVIFLQSSSFVLEFFLPTQQLFSK